MCSKCIPFQSFSFEHEPGLTFAHAAPAGNWSHIQAQTEAAAEVAVRAAKEAAAASAVV